MLVRRIRTIETPPAGAIIHQCPALHSCRCRALGTHRCARVSAANSRSPARMWLCCGICSSSRTPRVSWHGWKDGLQEAALSRSTDGVAAIFGASTVPSFRRLGVQSAVIRALISLCSRSGVRYRLYADPARERFATQCRTPGFPRCVHPVHDGTVCMTVLHLIGYPYVRIHVLLPTAGDSCRAAGATLAATALLACSHCIVGTRAPSNHRACVRATPLG